MFTKAHALAWFFSLGWQCLLVAIAQTDYCWFYVREARLLGVSDSLSLIGMAGANLLFFTLYRRDKSVMLLILGFLLFLFFMDKIDWGKGMGFYFGINTERPTLLLFSNPSSRVVLTFLVLIFYTTFPIWIRSHLSFCADPRLYWIPLLLNLETSSLVLNEALVLDFCYGTIPELSTTLVSLSSLYLALLLSWDKARERKFL